MFSILSPYCWRWYRSLSLCWRWIKITTVCIAVVVSGVKKNIIVIIWKLKMSFLHNYPSCSLIHILVNMYRGKLAAGWGGSDGVFLRSVAAAAALWIQTIFSFSSSGELSLNHPCNDTTYFCMFIWMCEKQRIFRFFHSLSFFHPFHTYGMQGMGIDLTSL